MRLFVNIMAWASLIFSSWWVLGATLVLTGRLPYVSSPPYGYVMTLVLGALSIAASIGLLAKRHWGRWLWIVTTCSYCVFLSFLNIAHLAVGLFDVIFTSIIAGIALVIGSGVWLLTRPKVRAMFHN